LVWVTNINNTFEIQTFHVSQLVYPALSLLGIILVFYYYSWFVSVVYTPPNLRESLVPILLAATEVAPMYFFGRPEYWWLFSGIFYLFGAIAFGSTILNIRENRYSNDFCSAVPVMRIELWSNILLCLALAILSYWSWQTYPQGHDFTCGLSLQEIRFLVILSLLIAIMASKSQFWFLRRIYLIGGLKEK